jgi:hypothetical protein
MVLIAAAQALGLPVTMTLHSKNVSELEATMTRYSSGKCLEELCLGY